MDQPATSKNNKAAGWVAAAAIAVTLLLGGAAALRWHVGQQDLHRAVREHNAWMIWLAMAFRTPNLMLDPCAFPPLIIEAIFQENLNIIKILSSDFEILNQVNQECSFSRLRGDFSGGNALHILFSELGILSSDKIRQIMVILLSSKIRVNVLNDNGRTPLDLAIGNGAGSELIQLLRDHGAKKATELIAAAPSP